jgi:hypothetical protein
MFKFSKGLGEHFVGNASDRLPKTNPSQWTRPERIDYREHPALRQQIYCISSGGGVPKRSSRRCRELVLAQVWRFRGHAAPSTRELAHSDRVGLKRVQCVSGCGDAAAQTTAVPGLATPRGTGANDIGCEDDGIGSITSFVRLSLTTTVG